MRNLILDLCGGTGSWSRPYRDAGYRVEIVDVTNGNDVRLLKRIDGSVQGVLAAPPCTHLAGSGARWWAEKGEPALLEALSVVDACLRIVTVQQPVWWVLENPVGRLVDYLGQPVMTFDPADYGDPYTKKTCLWGRFSPPMKQPTTPTDGSRMHRLPPSEDRAARRSVTPDGFAQAFFEANP